MASKRARDAPPPPEDPPEAEELTVLHLDDEDGSDANAPPLTVSMDNHGRVAGVGSLVIHKSLDVHTKVARNALSPGLARDLRHDCDAAFNAGSSFWLGVTDEPRCALEHMAKAVFDAHCDPEKVANKLDDTKTGAEWWVQMRCDDRDATEANAYNPLPTRDKNNPAGVSFHWDKDENLVDQFGVCVCPAVSTVTYVTDQGAPTVVTDKTPPAMYDDLRLFRGHIRRAVLSHPEIGKHLSFDGRFLHGAPREMGRVGLFDANQKEGGEKKTSPNAKKKQDQKEKKNQPYVRVTFLVNVWLGHKPRGLDLCPEQVLCGFGTGGKKNKSKNQNQNQNKNQSQWAEAAATVRDNIKNNATADFQTVPLTETSLGLRHLTYAFGETGTDHLLKIPTSDTLREWTDDGGTVGVSFQGELLCAVVEHPKEKSKAKRKKAT